MNSYVLVEEILLNYFICKFYVKLATDSSFRLLLLQQDKGCCPLDPLGLWPEASGLWSTFGTAASPISHLTYIGGMQLFDTDNFKTNDDNPKLLTSFIDGRCRATILYYPHIIGYMVSWLGGLPSYSGRHGLTTFTIIIHIISISVLYIFQQFFLKLMENPFFMTSYLKHYSILFHTIKYHKTHFVIYAFTFNLTRFVP